MEKVLRRMGGRKSKETERQRETEKLSDPYVTVESNFLLGGRIAVPVQRTVISVVRCSFCAFSFRDYSSCPPQCGTWTLGAHPYNLLTHSDNL